MVFGVQGLKAAFKFHISTLMGFEKSVDLLLMVNEISLDSQEISLRYRLKTESSMKRLTIFDFKRRFLEEAKETRPTSPSILSM